MEKEKKEYVYYCQDCNSLAIVQVTNNISYCKECGSGNIKKTTYRKWENINTNKKTQPWKL